MRRAASDSEVRPASRVSGRKRAARGARFEIVERPHVLAPEERLKAIARAVYLRALKAGFESRHELDDWLAAELEIAGIRVEKLAEDDLH